MMSGERSDERRASTGSNRRAPLGAAKTALVTLKKSFRLGSTMSPYSPNNRESRVTDKADCAPQDMASAQREPAASATQEPQKAVGSPCRMPSPLSPTGKMDFNQGSSPVTKKPLQRMQSDSKMALKNALRKTGSISRGLLGNMKCKEKKEAPTLTNENISDEQDGAREVQESYILPEIPSIPLSVIEIRNLIDKQELEEAHLNLLSLRRELQQEMEQCGHDERPIHLVNKEKDLSILYGYLRDKVKEIAAQANSVSTRNKVVLVHVARIIQEEDKRAAEPHGLYGPGGWMDAWFEAVGLGVEAKLPSKESTDLCLSVHLGLLGKAIVEDLEMVKKELQWMYPRSFKVFNSYVRGYSKAVGKHLEKLEQEVTKLEDLYAMLNWIMNDYESDRIIGSSSLQPEMCECESKHLLLPDGFLDLLTEKYCNITKEKVKTSLDTVIKLENDDVWSQSKPPEPDEDGYPNAAFVMDILQLIGSYINNSRDVDSQLAEKVASICLKEVKDFPRRFNRQFKQHCQAEGNHWIDYHIMYINSFSTLRQKMGEYQDIFPNVKENPDEEIKWLVDELIKTIEEQFKEDTMVFLRRMLTRKWLKDDVDFSMLCRKTEVLSEHCKQIRPPHAQELASRLHYHVVKKYISPIMNKNFSCKTQRHEKAASKLKDQLDVLHQLFEDMKSSHKWLDPLGDDLKNIIGQRDISDIKEQLWGMVLHFPDIRREHLAAVLYFRGVVRGREHQQILNKLSELTKDIDTIDRDNVFFGDMEVVDNTNSLSCLPPPCTLL